jgi:hypothetical protein
MKILQNEKYAAESECGVDVVIEDLDEFAIGGLAFCQLTNADYITRVMAPVSVG